MDNANVLKEKVFETGKYVEQVVERLSHLHYNFNTIQLLRSQLKFNFTKMQCLLLNDKNGVRTPQSKPNIYINFNTYDCYKIKKINGFVNE